MCTKKVYYEAALPCDNPLDGVVLVLLVSGSETFRAGDEILVRFCFGVCFFFSRPILFLSSSCNKNLIYFCVFVLSICGFTSVDLNP